MCFEPFFCQLKILEKPMWFGPLFSIGILSHVKPYTLSSEVVAVLMFWYSSGASGLPVLFSISSLVFRFCVVILPIVVVLIRCLIVVILGISFVSPYAMSP